MKFKLFDWPEKETENREGADVSSGSGHGREDSSDESGDQEDDGFPGAKVGNRVVRFALVLSAEKKRFGF
jgi:hypothetical protein